MDHKPETETPTERRCDRCAAPVPAFSPGGVCTSCLITSVIGGGGVDEAVDPPIAGAPVIPNFQISERLGEGGFGEVFAARQLRPVQREVAIKVLKPGAGGEHSLARFEAERQALALMDHPGIAHVYDAGETEDGRPFIVMERISGTPVIDFCKAGKLDAPARLRLFQKICAAVGHAHRRGIIHRDIKPSNILVDTKNGAAQPKVIDFGIAKATETLLTERTLLTQRNQLIGTPAYMSPEQAESLGAVDVRSDIYSLGVLLYELASGTPMFSQERLATLPYDEALRTIRTEVPPRPSLRARAQGVAGFSDDLDWIVMRAIEKEPARRYETASALARDVGAYLDGDCVEARPPSAGYRLRKFVRRNRAAVIAAGAIALALVAATVVSLNLFLQAEASATRAAASEVRNRQQFSLGDFTQADALVEASPGIAVAHLVRAVRSDPGNHAAATRLLCLLASEDWPTRSYAPIDHGEIVHAVAFSSDGEELLIAGDGNRLDIADAATGEVEVSLPLLTRPMWLRVSPDGVHAVVATWKNISLFDIEKRERIRSLPAARGRPTNVEFSADGTLVAAGFQGGSVRVWDVAGRTVVRAQQGGSFEPTVCFAPAGDRLAIADAATIRLISPRDPDSDRVQTIDCGTVAADLAFTPDGRKIVARCGDSTVRVFDLATGEPGAIIRHAAWVDSMAISPDSSLISTTAGNFAHVWELASGRPLIRPVAHEGEPVFSRFSPDGAWIASGAEGAENLEVALKVWDPRTGEPACVPIVHPRGVKHVAISPDGKRIAIGSRSRLTSVWEISPSAMEPLRMRHPAPLWRVTFDPEGGRLFTIMSGGETNAWDAADGERLTRQSQTTGAVAVAAHRAGSQTLRNGHLHRRVNVLPTSALRLPADFIAPQFHEGIVRAFAVTDDGEKLATGCADGALRLWSLRDGSQLGTLGHHESAITAIAFDAAGERVGSGDLDGNVRVSAVSGGVPTFTSKLHERRVAILAFSESGAALASGSADASARIIDLASGSVSPPLRHDGAVSQLEFDPGGQRLASSGRGNTARLWTVPSGEPLATPMRHLDVASDYGLYLMWTPGGEQLVTTASYDNTARVWDAATGRELVQAMSQPSGAMSAVLRADGRALVFGDDYDSHARVWDIATGYPLTGLIKHDNRVITCSYATDGRKFATGTMAGSAYVHPMPEPGIELPDEFLRYAESLGGFRFKDDGLLEPTPYEESVAPHPERFQDPWLRWLSMPRATRPPAP